jgi:hypothetical protein
VGIIGGVVALFSLLTSSIIYKVWFKGTSTKALEEGGLATFSFNFPFPFEAIFSLPPSTHVLVELAKVFMKEG